MAKQEKFKPSSNSLPFRELVAIADVTEDDVRKAMAKANKELKPFLNAD